MENVISLTLGQQILVVAVYTWMLVIFPVLVLRKLNYISRILEAQVEEDEEDDEGGGISDSMY